MWPTETTECQKISINLIMLIWPGGGHSFIDTNIQLNRHVKVSLKLQSIKIVNPGIKSIILTMKLPQN